jgi:hypothetical protein
MDELKIRPEFGIDRNNLDDEWIKNPGFYSYYAEQVAEATKLKDEIWLEKRILKATLYKKYRQEITDRDGKAPSDTRVDADVHADPSYKDVSLRLIEAEYQVNLLDGFKWATISKEKSLDHLSRNESKGHTMKDGFSESYQLASDRRNRASDEMDRAHRQRIKR